MRNLASASVGRLVHTTDALPVVHAVNYEIQDDFIVMRTGSDSKLASARAEEIVAFEVDDIAPHTRSGWSVVVTGRASEITEPAQRAHLRSTLRSWLPRTTDRFIRIRCDHVTGRSLPVATPSGPESVAATAP